MRVVQVARTGLASGLLALAAPHAMAAPDWGDVREPAAGAAEVFGGHARGCIAGAIELPQDGPGWQVMRPSRHRFFAHPRLVRFIEALAQTMQAKGGPGILVGDLAQPRGGPMSSGHASHQTGLDADIWLLPSPPRTLSSAERDEMPAVSMVAADGTGVTGAWTADHATILEAAASHPDVTRIFVNAAIKQELCRTVADGRAWLGKVRPWWGHDHHFHVRLRCPEGSDGCVDQAATPDGDGCDASLAWWFTAEAAAELERLRAMPRVPLTLADLPPACRAVLEGD